MHDNRIIFLDIDGVICLYPEWQHDWNSNQNDQLNDLCCKNLKAVIEATGAKIIITSSWRLDDQAMISLFCQLDQYDIAQEIIGKTADLQFDKRFKTHNELRWAEINDYIVNNDLIKYIIIDDFNLDKHDKAHLIRTKRHIGLTPKLRDVCINKLGVANSNSLSIILDHYRGAVSGGDMIVSKTVFIYDKGEINLVENNAYSWHECFEMDYDMSLEIKLKINIENSDKLLNVLGLSKDASFHMFEKVLSHSFKFNDFAFSDNSEYSREMAIKNRINDEFANFEKHCSLFEDKVVDYCLQKSRFKETKRSPREYLIELARNDYVNEASEQLNSLDKFILLCLRNKIQFDLYFDCDRSA